MDMTDIFSDALVKLILSKPTGTAEYIKIVAEKKQNGYQLSCYTQKQAFHRSISQDTLQQFCEQELAENYRQMNCWSSTREYQVLISKKGKRSYTSHAISNAPKSSDAHNRVKQYLLQEGSEIPPLYDMGIFTKEGKVVASMYDKYRQINRFLEIIDDAIKGESFQTLHIIDFGCGKSYLTFVVYYYLTQIRHLSVEMIGLDLKADVIAKCNQAAQKYGYDHLHFEVGDVNGYKAPFAVDMVLTLHACDTATDYALHHAIAWNARMIFSVPCCQHELNGQMKTDLLPLYTRYGIVKERFAALTTDAIRANLLTYCGYKTQLLEFVDFEQTPKNLLIRAVKGKVVPQQLRENALKEVQTVMQEFHLQPTLYHLLIEA